MAKEIKPPKTLEEIKYHSLAREYQKCLITSVVGDVALFMVFALSLISSLSKLNTTPYFGFVVLGSYLLRLIIIKKWK